MAKFIIRRFFLLLLTMILVSIAVFLITESSPGNVARNVLGSFITPEQEASFLAQMGLDKPTWLRYVYWLVGSDWHAEQKIGLSVERMTSEQGFDEWWAVKYDETLIRWKLEGEDLIAEERAADGEIKEYTDNERWETDEKGVSIFWGVDHQNHAVQWEKGSDRKVWTFVVGTGWMESTGGPLGYIPLKKGVYPG